MVVVWHRKYANREREPVSILLINYIHIMQLLQRFCGLATSKQWYCFDKRFGCPRMPTRLFHAVLKRTKGKMVCDFLFIAHYSSSA